MVCNIGQICTRRPLLFAKIALTPNPSLLRPLSRHAAPVVGVWTLEEAIRDRCCTASCHGRASRTSAEYAAGDFSSVPRNEDRTPKPQQIRVGLFSILSHRSKAVGLRMFVASRLPVQTINLCAVVPAGRANPIALSLCSCECYEHPRGGTALQRFGRVRRGVGLEDLRQLAGSCPKSHDSHPPSRNSV